jgi:hypothetical protein
MTHRLQGLGAGLILVAASVHGEVRAQSPPGEVPGAPVVNQAGQHPPKPAPPPAGAVPNEAAAAESAEVVAREGNHVTICGVMTRDDRGPFPYAVRAKGQDYRLDTRKNERLRGYLDGLPAGLRPLVRVDGVLETGPPAPDRGVGLPIAVWFLQPLDHTREMVRPPQAAISTAQEIYKEGGLVVSLPPESPLFDPISVALTRQGLKLEAATTDRAAGLIHASTPLGPPEPSFLAALELDRRIAVYPVQRYLKMVSDAVDKASVIKGVGGLLVTVPPDKPFLYDTITRALAARGLGVIENALYRREGLIFAEVQRGAPEPAFLLWLDRQRGVSVSPYGNVPTRLSPTESRGVGQGSQNTPPP